MNHAMERSLRSRRNGSPLLCLCEEIGAAAGFSCGRKLERELKVSASEEAILLTYKEEVRQRIMKQIRPFRMPE